MLSKELAFNLTLKNLNKFKQNIDVLMNNSNDSKLTYSFSFEEISNILGLLIHSSITGCKKDIIEILAVIIDSGKFNEGKYQDLVFKTLEFFEDEDFRLFY